LRALPRNLCATYAADELLRFAAEHTAADHFDPSAAGLEVGYHRAILAKQKSWIRVYPAFPNLQS
jgi:hypothetical protein